LPCILAGALGGALVRVAGGQLGNPTQRLPQQYVTALELVSSGFEFGPEEGNLGIEAGDRLVLRRDEIAQEAPPVGRAVGVVSASGGVRSDMVTG